MTLQIIDCEQNSEEWIHARMGIPTMSMAATIIASGKDGGPSLTRAKYRRQLAGEIITGEPMEGFEGNKHTERGHFLEDSVRDLYSFTKGTDPVRVGFIVNGKKGCSPDSLLSNDGILEIKTKLPDLQIEILERDTFPALYKAQCQGNLWVAEREWIDIAIWSHSKLPLFVKRAYRDEEYIKRLSDAVDKFNDELAALVERIRSYGSDKLAA